MKKDDSFYQGLLRGQFFYELRPWICIGFGAYAAARIPQFHLLAIPALFLIASGAAILRWRVLYRKTSAPQKY